MCTATPDGKVLFCGSDVAKALGYSRPNDAISAHCRGTVKRRIGVETAKAALNGITKYLQSFAVENDKE